MSGRLAVLLLALSVGVPAAAEDDEAPFVPPRAPLLESLRLVRGATSQADAVRKLALEARQRREAASPLELALVPLEASLLRAQAREARAWGKDPVTALGRIDAWQALDLLDPIAFNHAGVCYKLLGRPEEAARCYTLALVLHGRSCGSCHLGRAQTYLLAGDAEQARRDLDLALLHRLGPEDERLAWLLRGVTRELLGDRPGARGDLLESRRVARPAWVYPDLWLHARGSRTSSTRAGPAAGSRRSRAGPSAGCASRTCSRGPGRPRATTPAEGP